MYNVIDKVHYDGNNKNEVEELLHKHNIDYTIEQFGKLLRIYSEKSIEGLHYYYFEENTNVCITKTNKIIKYV